MKTVVTAQQMRSAEQAVFDAQPGVDLMSKAAAAVARRAQEIAGSGTIVVVAGSGNNGGDALYAASYLAATHQVRLWLPAGKAHPEALSAALAAGCTQVSNLEATEELGTAELVIDGVAGLNCAAGLKDVVATFAEACVATATAVLSVDLPSGLVADSAALAPSFHATCTVTFGAVKPCHVLLPAAQRCGQVHVADIAVPVPQTQLRQAEPADLVRWWPWPKVHDDKYSRGVVLLDTGSLRYPGAGLLSCTGALHGGAGLVRYAGPVDGALIMQAFPSVVLGTGQAQATVLGSGWGERPDGVARLAQLVGRACVIDADALRYLPPGPLEGWLLTPHAGELARLLGCARSEVLADPLAAVRQAARQLGAVVLLKGATQYVAEPDGRVTLAVPGPAWSATAGSGDVLAGLCGALLAAGLPAWQAGVAGASLQAMTAAQYVGPRTPDELARHFPDVLAGLAEARPDAANMSLG